MPHYHATVTLELHFSAPEQYEADRIVGLVVDGASRARPDVTVTVGADTCEEERPDGWDLAMARVGM